MTDWSLSLLKYAILKIDRCLSLSYTLPRCLGQSHHLTKAGEMLGKPSAQLSVDFNNVRCHYCF